ncbi:DUF1643 domain-containing protein [Azospirillum sp. sgz302134]
MTTLDLFGTPAHPAHDPGGKVKTALPAGLRGDAEFSDCGRYRRLLRRWIGDEFPDRHWLLIGMNPSTADATHNDPTVAREWSFTVREGYMGFTKCNVGDYRATVPADLSKPGVVACSADNLPTILRAAEAADRVVACFGRVPRPLVSAPEKTVRALRERGIDLWCFGTNADGSPKHPLYLRGTTPLTPFR